MSSPTEVARELAELSRRIANLEGNRTFANVAIDGASLPVRDEFGNTRHVLGLQADGTYGSIDFNAPPPTVPDRPTIVSGLGAIVVTWNGLTANGSLWGLDFSHVEVHLFTGDGPWVPANATQVGIIPGIKGGGVTISGVSPALTYRAVLVAVNRGGGESEPSEEASGSPREAVTQAELDAITAEASAAAAEVANRPKAYYSATPPVAPEGGFRESDQWWELQPDGSYTGHRWDLAAENGAGGWVGYQFGGDALVTDAVSARHIVADAVDATKIAAEAIATRHLGAESVTSANIAARSIEADKFAAVLALVSRMSTGQQDEAGNIIGQRTEISSDGLKNIRTDNELNAYIPNDPAATGFFRGALETGQLRVAGGLSIESDRNEFAKDSVTALSGGVSAPQEAPTIQYVYEKVQLDRTTKVTHDMGTFALDPTQITGIGWDQWRSAWNVAQQRAAGTRIWVFEGDGSIRRNADGAFDVFDLDDFSNINGLFSINTLGGDLNSLRSYIGTFQGGTYYLAVHTPGGKYHYNQLTASAVINTAVPLQLGYDKTMGRYYIAQCTNNGTRLNIQYLTLSETATTGDATVHSTRSMAVGTGRSAELVAAIHGDYSGAGVKRFYTAHSNLASVLVTGEAAGSATIAGEQFPMPTTMMGMAHDGTHFYSVDSAGWLTRYENWTWTDAADKFYAGYTHFDSDPVGGQHETLIGRLGSITAVKRARLSITVPIVPDKGGQDDPDKFRLYVARASATPGRESLIRVAETGSASLPTTVVLTGDPVGIERPPTDPNPFAFPGANPARLQSSTVDTAGRNNFVVDGGGGGRWPRLVPVGTVKEWSGITLPTGWLYAEGEAVSRTLYPELAALYWDGTKYVHGNGDGSTTFNLPNPARGAADVVSSAVLTAVAGYSIQKQSFRRVGNIVVASFDILKVGNQGNNAVDYADRAMATVDPAWTPLDKVGFASANKVRVFSLDPNGTLYSTAGMSSTTVFDIADGEVLSGAGAYSLTTAVTSGSIRKIVYAG